MPRRRFRLNANSCQRDYLAGLGPNFCDHFCTVVLDSWSTTHEKDDLLTLTPSENLRTGCRVSNIRQFKCMPCRTARVCNNTYLKDVGQVGQVGQGEVPMQAFYSCPFVSGFYFDGRKGATYLGILQVSYIYRYMHMK